MSDGISLAGLVRQGDCIAWGGAASEPIALLERLSTEAPSLPPCTGFANLGLSEALDPARLPRHVRIKALGGSGTNRRFGTSGHLDILPGHYSALPDLVRDRTIVLDVLLLMLAPGGNGYNFGPQVDYLADALPHARVVVAEVNDRAPETCGETAVERAHVDQVTATSRPVVELPVARSGETAKLIGAHVARLVPDGATIQAGLGALPDAILAALTGKKDLGLHSGTIGDRAADLIEAGVITNRRKPVDTGISITAGLLGTSRIYKFAHRNPALHIRSPRYTHDNLVHARLPSLIGINSALEVDLTGQMNAEVVGGRHIGMIGGHADFMRGCLRSPGGRGIVAIEATAAAGRISRIVPRLPDAVVTTSRSDADIVVTEFGIAELRGRTLRERAAALIRIAHPDFRAGLERAADRLV